MLIKGLASRPRLALLATAGVVVAAVAAIALVVGAGRSHEDRSPARAGRLSSLVASAMTGVFAPIQRLTDLDVKRVVAATMLEVTHQRSSTRPVLPNGKPGWPSNVARVLAIRDTHADALRFVGAAPSDRGPVDNRNVLVVRAFGSFDFPITGPPGTSHHTHGTILTLVVDPSNGYVYDFGVDRSSKTTPALPGATEIH